MVTEAPPLDSAEILARRASLEASVRRVKRRRADVADRLGLAVAVPAAVSPRERRVLRTERAALEVELTELLDGLTVLRTLQQ